MIIHRTIFKELIKNLTVIIFSLSVLLFMEKFVKLTRLFMGKGADLIDIIKIFLYLQPSLLLLSIPMAILIAIFLTYGRMSTDNETVVLKATGMSFPGIAKASITLAVVCSLILLFVSLYLLPRSMHSFRHTLHETIVKKASMTFEEETFSDMFKGTVIFVKDIPAKDEFRGIFVYRDADSSSDKSIVIVAESGVIRSSPDDGLIKLNMSNGLIHTFKDNSSSEITFSEYDFILTSGIQPINKIKPEEIKTLALWKERKEKPKLAIELNRRLALPFACLIFGILGPALSNKIGKVGRLGGFSLSLSILICYYTILIMGEGLAKTGKISPFAGGWAPNILFGVIALSMFFIAYKDRPFKKF
jgi:lipopolysaccharide export system permease protein